MGGSVTVRLNLNASGYSAEMTKAQRTMRGFASATRQMGHGTVSQMQAASAAIRVLEGGMTGNIRAAERFISTIPGVGKALQAAFPIVGGIALAGVFVKIGEEAVKAVQKIQQAPQVIANSFREMNLSAETSIDTLKLSTAKMQEQIALLTGKRPNTLAEELAEASLAADKLATSLDNDNRKIAEILKANGLSFLSGFLGKAGTADVAGSVNSFDQQMADLAAQHQHAVRTGDTSGAASLAQQLDDKRNAALAYANSQIAQRQNQGVGGLNQDANLAVLTGFKNTLIDQQDQEKDEAANKATAVQLKRIEDARKYAELLKETQGKIVTQWRQALDEDRANSEISTAQEAAYWLYRAQTAKKGSQSYIAALDEANKAIAKINADTMREQKSGQLKSQEFDETAAKSYLPDSMDLSRGDTSQLEAQGRAAADYLRDLNEGIALQHANASAIAEASIQMGLATGQMSKLDAAQAQAALHAQQYRDAIAAIDQALANAQILPDGFDKQATIAGLNNQRTQAAGAYQVQSSQDQTVIESQSLGVQLARMAQDWQDMTTKIAQTISTTMSGLNDNLAKMVTGQYKQGDMGKTLLGAGQGLIKTAIGGFEGMALGALGLGGKSGGKPDGTKGNPIYTIDAGGSAAGIPGGAGGVPGIAGSLLGKIPGLGEGSAWGSALTGIASFLPHFAGGGDILANRPSIVGEQGPELFMPSTSGRIVPNHALGGGDTHNHFVIDARGATDPAAIEAAVRRAAPGIVAASVQAQHSKSKRTPGR